MPLSEEELARIINPLGPGPITMVLDRYSLRCNNCWNGIVCDCPTHIKLFGEPYCYLHTLHRVNELLTAQIGDCP